MADVSSDAALAQALADQYRNESFAYEDAGAGAGDSDDSDFGVKTKAKKKRKAPAKKKAAGLVSTRFLHYCDLGPGAKMMSAAALQRMLNRLLTSIMHARRSCGPCCRDKTIAAR